MERKIPCINGDEFDTFSDWREFMVHRSGKFTAVKKRYRKRARQIFKREIESELLDDDFDLENEEMSEEELAWWKEGI